MTPCWPRQERRAVTVPFLVPSHRAYMAVEYESAIETSEAASVG
eukprot:COSAG02_NODE_1440_length_12590_cov_2.822352_3_plen_44_part_00